MKHDNQTSSRCLHSVCSDPRGKDGNLAIVHNCCQATARDVLAGMIRNCEDAGHRVLFNVHDEIVCLVPEIAAEEAKADILRIMSVAPSWMPGLPVEAEAIISKTYTK